MQKSLSEWKTYVNEAKYCERKSAEEASTDFELLDAHADVEAELCLDDDEVFVDEEAVVRARHVCDRLVHGAQTRLPLAAVGVRLEQHAVQRRAQCQVVVWTSDDP